MTRSPRTPLSNSSSADRKSTRLNSSHLGISYAVFCLKKKKIHTTPNKTTAVMHKKIQAHPPTLVTTTRPTDTDGPHAIHTSVSAICQVRCTIQMQIL